MTLHQEWIEAKEAERVAVDRRREIEDIIVAQADLAQDFEGTKNLFEGEYQVKIVGRLNQRIDGEALQQIASAYGLEKELMSLFRWKPEVNLTKWKITMEEIKDRFSQAITVTPGRPSFTITKKGE